MTEIPRWGRVVAQPHEFLIVMRNGKVRFSGQGASVFKWPSDSVAVLPTSIAKLGFAADQVTREKTGVAVTGLAVYRIVDPLLAFKMVDWERSSLSEILRDMFIGATRRIVAGLTLEECLTHRKERVAQALMHEIAPVLAGDGAEHDTTSQGWGVVLDTIEIQDVKVLSAEVFSRLQAPYREQLALAALRAQNEVAEERARLDAEQKVAAERARRALMGEEEKRILAERARDAEMREYQHKVADAAQQKELARLHAKAEAERSRASLELAHKREAGEMELALRREAGELDAALTREKRAAQADLSQARLDEILLTETMPQVANAFRNSFGTIHVTQTDGGPLLGFLSSGLEQVLEVARKRGPKVG